MELYIQRSISYLIHILHSYLSLHNKDLEIALSLASHLGIELPVTNCVKEMEEDLLRRGYQNKDISVLLKWFKADELNDV